MKIKYDLMHTIIQSAIFTIEIFDFLIYVKLGDARIIIFNTRYKYIYFVLIIYMFFF